MKNSRKSNVRGMAQPALAVATFSASVRQYAPTKKNKTDQEAALAEIDPNLAEEEQFTAFLSSHLPPLQAPPTLAQRIRHLTLHRD